MDQQLLNSISDLQDREKQLQQTFESNSPEMKKKALEDMMELTRLRVEMFNTFKTQYARDVSQSKEKLNEQVATLQIVENELNQSQNELRKLNQQYVDKMRMVEISTYFSEKYAAYNELVKLIIMWAIPVAIIAFIGMRNPVPETMLSKENSNTVFLVILLVVGLIGLFQILVKVYDLSRRNNMNFNEYDFDVDFEIDKMVEKSGPLGARGVDDGEGIVQHDTSEFEKMAESLNLGCVDSKCCSDGTMFDTLKKRCIPAMKAHDENNKKAALTKGSFTKDAEGIEHKASSLFGSAEHKASSLFGSAEHKASSAFGSTEHKASSAFHSALSMVEPMSNDIVPFSSV
jgi:hypothetical protein